MTVPIPETSRSILPRIQSERFHVKHQNCNLETFCRIAAAMQLAVPARDACMNVIKSGELMHACTQQGAGLIKRIKAFAAWTPQFIYVYHACLLSVSTHKLCSSCPCRRVTRCYLLCFLL